MCFSLQADLVAGAALVPIAVLSLREVRTRRELPFALLPALFCVHQLSRPSSGSASTDASLTG